MLETDDHKTLIQWHEGMVGWTYPWQDIYCDFLIKAQNLARYGTSKQQHGRFASTS